MCSAEKEAAGAARQRDVQTFLPVITQSLRKLCDLYISARQSHTEKSSHDFKRIHTETQFVITNSMIHLGFRSQFFVQICEIFVKNRESQQDGMHVLHYLLFVHDSRLIIMWFYRPIFLPQDWNENISSYLSCVCVMCMQMLHLCNQNEKWERISGKIALLCIWLWL